MTPTVDLAKIENTDEIIQNKKVSLPNYSSPLISTQNCNKILKNVANIYNVGDSTYAKPCQSYRQFKTDLVSNSNVNTSSISTGKRNTNSTSQAEYNPTSKTKRPRRALYANNEANKENVSLSVLINIIQKI